MVHISCGNLNLNLHECHHLHPGLVDPTHNENSLNMTHLSPLKLPSKKTSKFQDGKMDGIWKRMGILSNDLILKVFEVKQRFVVVRSTSLGQGLENSLHVADAFLPSISGCSVDIKL